MRFATTRPDRIRGTDVFVGAACAWAALMCGLGTLNIIIAVTLPLAAWAWFIVSGPLHPEQAPSLLSHLRRGEQSRDAGRLSLAIG
jgi:hypothetical protein